MNGPSRTFDWLARPYRALERLALGGALEEARFALLPRLASCRRVLVLGDGDGRLTECLLLLAPCVRVDSLDWSPGMQALARERLRADLRERVRFRLEDVRSAAFEPGAYDAVVTAFFLDCFEEATLRAMLPRLASALAPGGLWLYADFALPERGWRRWRARLWLGGLYAFFRLTTEIAARRLPESERLLEETGLRRQERRSWQAGLLCAALYSGGRVVAEPLLGAQQVVKGQDAVDAR